MTIQVTNPFERGQPSHCGSFFLTLTVAAAKRALRAAGQDASSGYWSFPAASSRPSVHHHLLVTWQYDLALSWNYIVHSLSGCVITCDVQKVQCSLTKGISVRVFIFKPLWDERRCFSVWESIYRVQEPNHDDLSIDNSSCNSGFEIPKEYM